MTVRTSSGMRAGMLTDLKARLEGAIVRLYPGTQPTSADDAEGIAHLVEVTLDGLSFSPGSPTNGLVFGDISHNTSYTLSILAKPTTAVWKGAALADGSIGWGRIYANDVDTGQSYVAERIDGMASTAASADLVLSTSTVQAGVEVTISALNLNLSYQ